MRYGRIFRSLSMPDRAALAVVVLCAVIALGRFASIVAVVPYAAYLNQRDAAAAKASGQEATATPLLARIAVSRPFHAWWGGRRVPRQAGGDYLEVISYNTIARPLGCIVGVIAEQYRVAGIPMDRVLVPEDRTALYGKPPGTPVLMLDGRIGYTYWSTPAEDAAHFTDVPVIAKAYTPVITAAQSTALDATAGLKKKMTGFYVGTPVPGGSGTWILLARVGATRDFLLVPIEVSPVGGAL